MARIFTPVHGIELDADVEAGAANPALGTGFKLNSLGQTNNTDAANVANQNIGTKALPALSSLAEGTLTVANTLVTTKSLIFVTISEGTTRAGAGARAAVQASVRNRVAATSFDLELHNLGSAATLSTDYVVHYWIVN